MGALAGAHAFPVFGTAIGVSLVATPVVRALVLRAGVYDQPGARKFHVQPTPLLGGLAIGLAYIVAVQVGASGRLHQAGVLAGGVAILLVGLWDDLRHLPPLTKLLGQLLAGGITVAFGLHSGLFRTPVLDAAVTVFWVLAVTNALNLSDNMDGLSAGLAAIAAGWFLVFGLLAGEASVTTASLALCGACLGFLRYNFSPARIFMGDTGSMFIGYMLAVLGLRLAHDTPWPLAPALPVLILGVPIFDTAFVMWRRWREGRSIADGGRDHTSHRLVAIGYTARDAVCLLYLIGLGCGTAALVVAHGGLWLGVVTLVGLGVVAVAATHALGRVRVSAQEVAARKEAS